MFLVPFSFKTDVSRPAPTRQCGFPFTRPAARVFLFIGILFPLSALPAWQLVVNDQGKRIDIDRESIVAESDGKYSVKSRIVLDKPIVDPRTAVAYQSIEIEHRFDCPERTHATLKRTYYKENGDLLNQEEVKNPFYMAIRSGTADDRLLRVVCRPKNTPPGNAIALENINAGLLESLRKHNEAMIEQGTKKEGRNASSQINLRIASGSKSSGRASSPKKPNITPKKSGTAPKPEPGHVPGNPRLGWSYFGEADGPGKWGSLRPEYALCSSGKRQSPIDIQDAIALDLDTVKTDYTPAMMRVVDSEKSLFLLIYGGGMTFQGKEYELTQINFHRPAETTVGGKVYDMEAQIVHRAVDDGKLAVVSVLLEKGLENPVLQTGLNHLPLERGGEVMPPDQLIEVDRLLPAERKYFAFMGSLTTPPCTEDVIWIVFMQPQQVSAAQLAIYDRLYKPNARPVQPAFDRLIKVSR
ncbi:MAG: carbonic anhydrase family protein [Candidatus Accumulibacter sp.]|jgi:carbonic anhydrase|nr:carbonic anhydrase family protein [Accumulibacter sp.]